MEVSDEKEDVQDYIRDVTKCYFKQNTTVTVSRRIAIEPLMCTFIRRKTFFHREC